MDPVHAPFLAAILADVDSDAPRLKYADYLDETGESHHEARAEFIRVQCALEGMRTDGSRYEELTRREKELLQAYWREWFAPIREVFGVSEFVTSGISSWWKTREAFELNCSSEGRDHFVVNTAESIGAPFGKSRFRRGFLSAMELYPQPQAVFERLFELTPLTEVRWCGVNDELQSLLQADRLSQLRTLFLSCLSAVRTLAISSRSNSLRRLTLELNHFSADLQLLDPIPWLVNSVQLKGLRELVLNVEPPVFCDLRPLIGSSLLTRLEVLWVRRPSFPRQLLAEIVRPEIAPNLVELRVGVEEFVEVPLRIQLSERFGNRLSSYWLS